MKEKLPGLFPRPLMKFNVTAVMVIILMFSVFNVFSIVRTQQRQASLQTMALKPGEPVHRGFHRQCRTVGHRRPE